MLVARLRPTRVPRWGVDRSAWSSAAGTGLTGHVVGGLWPPSPHVADGRSRTEKHMGHSSTMRAYSLAHCGFGIRPPPVSVLTVLSTYRGSRKCSSIVFRYESLLWVMYPPSFEIKSPGIWHLDALDRHNGPLGHVIFIARSCVPLILPDAFFAFQLGVQRSVSPNIRGLVVVNRW